MDIEILDEKENKFFKRKDLTLSVKHNMAATPKKADIIREVAESRKVDESQVSIDYVFTKKGDNESMVKMKVLNEKPPVKEERKDEAQDSKGA